MHVPYDIEDDIANPATVEKKVTMTVQSRTRKTKEEAESHGPDVPGDATIYTYTFGCGHNVSDGEYMAGQLIEAGYRVTDNFDIADAYLINSCTVKNPSEDHFVTLLRRSKGTGKPVVVAGCVPQADQQNKEWNDVSVVGVRHIDKVVDVVAEALRGNTVRLLSNNTGERIPTLALPKVRRNQFIEIIVINVGCLNHCTYCKTKAARGNLKSWPIEEVVDRVRQVLAEGVVEIRLTSEDTGAYGIDINTDIVALLDAIVEVLEGTNVMLRIGMSNPPYLLKHLHEVARIMNHPNVFAFIHIPVQSGSNAILSVMEREYSCEEFEQCVNIFREKVPDISISTDIICAFPGEGDEEWQETMDLCRRVVFPILNISRFYARRGTPAAAMPQIPTQIAKKRSVELTNFYNTYSLYDHLVGTTHSFWLTETAHDKHSLVGHTKTFVQVLVKPDTCNLGDYVTVQISRATKYSVFADVVAVDKDARMRLIEASKQKVLSSSTAKRSRSVKTTAHQSNTIIDSHATNKVPPPKTDCDAAVCCGGVCSEESADRNETERTSGQQAARNQRARFPSITASSQFHIPSFINNNRNGLLAAAAITSVVSVLVHRLLLTRKNM